MLNLTNGVATPLIISKPYELVPVIGFDLNCQVAPEPIFTTAAVAPPLILEKISPPLERLQTP